MYQEIKIGTDVISRDHPVYIVAEMSGNHNMDLGRAKAIIDAAADAGANAVKLQTYTPDTITVDCRGDMFLASGPLWEGRTLYELYQEAHTPWEWHEALIDHARGVGLECFSAPFDFTAVDFLEELQAPAYKIASCEMLDVPLIRRVAQTGKPIILSTGIARLEDIELALRTCEEEGNEQVILLKCVAAYPAPFRGMNLRVLPNMEQTFHCLTGLSDHSFGDETAVAAVALGAKMVEKHLTLRRSDGGPDAGFSMEPEEFSAMVRKIRNTEEALGKVSYELTDEQLAGRRGARSLFVVQDIKKGERFSSENVRSIRPGNGMHTKYYDDVLGRRARSDLVRGTPLRWEHIE